MAVLEVDALFAQTGQGRRGGAVDYRDLRPSGMNRMRLWGLPAWARTGSSRTAGIARRNFSADFIFVTSRDVLCTRCYLNSQAAYAGRVANSAISGNPRRRESL